MSAQARSDIVGVYRRMLADDLIRGTAGNVSVRTGRGMIITPSSIPAGAMDEASLSEFDLNRGLVSGSTRPSSEWLLHLAVYRNTQARAVIHTHSLAATAVSLIADELPAVHYYIVRLGGPVPVLPYATYGSEELAGSCGEGLADRGAVILANHGAVTTGSTLEQAYERATWLEWLCDLYLKAAAVGVPRSLTREDLELVREQAGVIEQRGYVL